MDFMPIAAARAIRVSGFDAPSRRENPEWQCSSTYGIGQRRCEPRTSAS
jgi:hypothetical protein